MNRCFVPSLVVFCLVAFAVPAAGAVPAITGFTPLSGPVGTVVTITGSGFTGATGVAFGSGTATIFTVDFDTQITVTVPASATTGVIGVTTPGGTGTSVASFTVCVPPDATITAPTGICVNSTGNVASVPLQSGATYNWVVGNGTLTGGQNTNSITFTAGAQPWVNLDVDVTTSCGTAHGAVGLETGPPVAIHSPSLLCPNTTGNVADVALVAATTYAWTLTGPGTITSATNTNAITFSTGSPGEIQLTVTSTNLSCGTSTNTMAITVGTPVIASYGRFCTTTTDGAVSVPWSPIATYAWTISGNATFTSPPTNNWVSVVPSGAGSFTVSVTVGGLSCSPITVTKTIAIDPPAAPLAITAPAVVCANSTGQTATATPYLDAVYNWSINNGTITGGQGTNSITFNAGGAGGVNLSVSTNLGCGWSNAGVSVPINADTTITAPANVCINSTGNVASVPAQAGATYNWTVNSGTLTAGQGTNSITFTAGTQPWVNLNVDVTTSCGTAHGFQWVETGPPVAIQSTPLVCPNTTGIVASVTLVPGTTYSWTLTGPGTITGGANTNSITYDAAGSGQILLGITSTNSCGTSTSAMTIFVGTPAIQTVDRVCATAPSPYNANIPGAPGATYLWSISGGTFTPDSSPTNPWVNFTPYASGSVTLTATITGPACGPFNLTKTIPIDSAASTVAITAPAVVCANTTGNTATATPYAGAVYNWAVNGGTITAGQGTNTITFTAGTNPGGIDLNVSTNLGCGWTNAPAHVSINADTTITAPASVCINSTGNAASVPAQGGATYSWTINGGTITSATNAASVTFTAGTQPSVVLNVDVTTSCGTARGSLWIETSPPVAIHGPTLVCSNTTANAADVTLIPGTTYSWTLTGPGTITSATNTNSITYSAAGPGQIVLGVTSSNSCGTSTNTMFITVGTPAIQSVDRVCSTSVSANASLPWANGATYSWTIAGGTFTPDSNPTWTWVNFTPAASGSVTLTATISGTACGTFTVTKTIPIDPPSATIAMTTPPVVCANSTGNIASATALAGVVYNWSISNGTITAGQGTSAITFSAGASGQVNLGVNAGLGCGPFFAGANVPINAITTITAPASVCINSTGNVASVPAQGGATYSWTIGAGTITAGQGTSSITFTAGTQPWTNLNVTVTTSCGSASGGRNVATSPATGINTPGIVCSGSSNTASVPLESGTTYNWSITGGTITSATNLNSITYDAGATGPVQLSITSTGSCGTNSSGYRVDVGAVAINNLPARLCANQTNVGVNVNYVAGATYSWTITGGTFTSSPTNSFVSFNAGPSGTVSLSVTVSGVAGCGPFTTTTTIPIDTTTPPSIAITAPPYVCANATATASATPLPGFTYNWSVGNGTITAGQGTDTITFTAGTSGTVNLSVGVTTGCGGNANANLAVGINASMITAAPGACINSSANTASVSAPAGSTYSWSVGGGTIASGQGTNSITFTPAAVPSVNVSVNVTNSCGTAFQSTNVRTSPATLINTPGIVCASSSNTASVALETGTTYNWSIVGGTITSATNTNSITYTAGTTTPVQLTITSTGSCGTNTNTLNVDVAAVTISVPSRLCASVVKRASVSFVSGATYMWSITGGTLTSSATNSWVDFNPGTSGAVSLSVTVSGLSCGPLTATKTIPIDPSPSTVAITAPATACPNTTATASATAYAGAVYNWSVANGTIVSGQGTSTIQFTPGAPGTVDLNVNVNLGCGNAGAWTSVPVPTTTWVYFSAPATVCANTSGVTATVSDVAPGDTYTWTLSNGTITSGQGTSTLTFTAGASGTMNLQIVRTTSCGMSSIGYTSIPINGVPTAGISGPASLCAGASATARINAPAAGSAFAWTIANGTITSATNISSITFTAGSSGDVVLEAAVTTCGNTVVGRRVMPINPPIAPVIYADRVCPNSTNNWANVSGWPNGATFAWTITNGTITSSTTGSNVWYTAGPSGNVTLSVSVSSCGVTGGTSTTVPISAPPDIHLSGSYAVCANSPGNIAEIYGGAWPPNATIAWTITNGTITAGVNSEAIVYTAGASGLVTLTATVTACNVSSTASLQVLIGDVQVISLAATASVCAGSAGNVASVTNPGPGTTYRWSIVNGTITSPIDIPRIEYSAGTSGNVGLTAVVTTCAGSRSITRLVPIDSGVSLAITSDDGVCPSSNGNTASVSPPPGSSVLWSIANGTITSATTGAGVTFAAGASGSVTLTASVTSCGITTTATRNIPIGGTPISTILAWDASGTVHPRPTVTSVNPGAVYIAQTGFYPYTGIIPTVYRWTITNGTLLDNPNDPQILFQAGTTGTTTLTVTVTACGGTSTSSFSIPIVTAVSTITAPAFICTSATASASVALQSGATYAWTITNGSLASGQGTNAIAFTAGATGAVGIAVTVNLPNGTSSSSSVSVPITTTIATVTPSGATTFCQGGSVTLTASTGAAYQWFAGTSPITGATAQTYVATTSGSYSVRVTGTTGCAASSPAVAVTAKPAPLVTIDGPSSVCANVPFTLDAGAGYSSYLWSTGETTRSINVSATTSTTFTVTVTNSSACSMTASSLVTVTTTPAATIVATGPTTFCEGGSVVLTASDGTSYQWFKDGQPLGTIQTITATTAGSYTVQVTSGSCVGTSDPTIVTVNSLPSAAVTTSGSTTFCSGGSVTLTASAASSYQWLNNGQPVAGATGISYNATTSGNYSVQVTNASGCTAVSSIVPVTANAPPAVSIAGPGTVCPGGSVTLDAGAGFSSWLWSTGATTQTITVSPAATTTYIVTVNSAAGCSATAAKTVALIQPAPPVITAPPSACPGSTNNAASVVAQTGATYSWTITGGTINGAATASSITFTAGTSGIVTLSVTTSGGCSGSATATVPIGALASPTITGPASSCPGSSVTLDAGAGFSSYLWSTGATTQTITVAPATTTTYSVTVQNASGCSANASHSVTVAAGTSPVIAAPASVCAGSSGNTASVASTSGASYTWTITGGTITAGDGTSAITFAAGASGSVSIGVTVVSSSCGGTASQTVPIVEPPTVAISGPAAICGGTSVTLDAGSGFASYVWSTGATTQTITDTPSIDTIYSVTVTSAAGCSASASATVAVSASPTPKITVVAGILAGSTGNVASVAAGPAGTTYVWTITGGTIIAGAGTERITFTAAQSGTVTLAVDMTTPGGCKGSQSLNVAISASADLALTMTGSSNTVNVAGTLTYTINVSNNGPSTASNVSVALAARSGASVTGASGTGWTCVAEATTATCTVATAPLGALPAITLRINAPSTVGSISTTATVTSSSTDPEGGNNAASITASVTGALCSTTPAQLSTPADAAANLTTPITFSWTAVPNATSYEVWVGADGAAPTILATTSSTSVAASVSGNSAIWYVAARLSGDCPMMYSARRSFTLFQPPTCVNSAPLLVAPADKATTTSPVTFSWTAAPDAIGYRVWIAVNDAPAQDIGTTAAGTTNLTATVNPGTIGWFVEASFAGCPTVPSAARTFTILKPDPCAGHAAASLTAPADKSTTTSSIDFQWKAATGASGYRVWAKIDDAPFAVLGVTTTGATALTGAISSGHVEWYIETLFDGCPSIESEHRMLDVPKAVTCGTEVAQLVSPAEGAAVSQPTVTFFWAAVPKATSYELWLALGSGTPGVLGTTTLTTLTKDVPPGAIEWFVRANFDGCPQRDSANGHLTYTPPPACSDARPSLNTPANNATSVFSPVDLTWREVPGASSYKVWMTSGNAVSLVATTTNGSLSGVALPPERIEWYVEAVIGGNCPSTTSTPSFFTVVPPPPPCLTPDPPMIIAETTASSGSQYTIRWQGVVPGDSSVIQESQDGTFINAAVINTASDSYSFLHTNTTTAPITFYYRVRGISQCGENVQVGPYGSVAAVVILPDKPTAGQQLQGATGTGSAQSIIYEIPLDASLAGLAFTAVPNESWLTVTPSSGVIPVGGMSLKVVANTAGLPVGTTLGGITITTHAVSASSRAVVKGVGTVNTTVSVNLVQPVLPTPKSTPPPDALIIPAVAHADGINSKFQSDVRLTNTSAQVMKYQITFIPSGDEGIKQGKQTSLDVDPGRTVALDDILGTWFNSGAFKSLTGTLEIRPLTQSATSTSSVSATGLRNLVTFASSRTYAVTASGTYGQYIPAIPFANFVGGTSVLSLQQIAQSAAYRTNLGIVEGSGQPASVLISVFTHSGDKLKEFSLNLAGGQHAQLDSFLSQQGVQLNDGRVEVKVTSPNGRVTAYASVLDNTTNDPMLVTPVVVNQGATASKYVIPGVADLNNGLANWRTDARVLNASASSVEATLSFYSQSGGAPRTAQITLAPNEIKQLDGLLSSVFGVTNDGGALHITTAQPSNLVATARTYNDTGKGTYGQFISAVTANDATALGSRPLQLLQVEESDRFRSNIGLAEVSGKAVKVQLSVVPPDSRVTPNVEVDLGPNEFRQLNSLVKQLGLPNMYNARVTVKVIRGDGRVTAYASVIDAVTQDPTYVPAQ